MSKNNDLVKRVRDYIKKQVKWSPWDKEVLSRIGKEYMGEEYMILTGRDSVKSATLNHLNFVDLYTAKCIIKHECYFRALLIRLSDMSVVEEHLKCICLGPKKPEEIKKIRCLYCKTREHCGCAHLTKCNQ